MNRSVPQPARPAAGARALPRLASATPLVLAVATLAGGLLLAGCGKKEEKGATQVAAKVNGDEITVHQLNFVLKQQRVPADGPQADQVRRQILERMVEQQVAVQRAEKEKLDRDPEVMQALEAMRRDVITRFYIERVAEKAAKPTADEVRAWYDGKPAQYAQRRTWVIQKVDANVPADRRAEVVEKVQAAPSAAAVTEWLKSQDIKFNVSTANPPSEALGPLLDKVAALKDGQTVAVPQAFGVTVITLQSSSPAPIPFEQARGQIEQQLWNERKREAVMAEVKSLRQDAKVEYVGAFAASAPAAPSPAIRPASMPAAPVAIPSASSPAASGAIDPATLQKGLGIK